MARILSRRGVYVSAMPLAVEALGDCRMCREHREVMEHTSRLIEHDQGREAYGIGAAWLAQMEGHSCEQWMDVAFMAPRRGPWLSVRIEKGIYDPILKADYRIPLARADCWYTEEEGSFRVVHAPLGAQEGRIAQWFLDGLEPDELPALFADLKAA